MVMTGLFDFRDCLRRPHLDDAMVSVLPGWPVVLLPAFLGMAMLAALGVSLWLSVANVEFRDVQHAMPFLIQVWMFATPIVYPASLVPGHWRLVYTRLIRWSSSSKVFAGASRRTSTGARHQSRFRLSDRAGIVRQRPSGFRSVHSQFHRSRMIRAIGGPR